MVIDLTGRVFGRWRVESRSARRCSRNRSALWTCRCECGTVKAVSSESLRQGLSRSCGCLVSDTNRKRNTLPEGEAYTRQQLRYYKRSARDRGHSWGLSDVQVIDLLKAECLYCGEMPAKGIDRFDNAFGYVRGNAMPCCKVCNYAKRTMSAPEFFAWIKKVAKHLSYAF